MQKNAIVVFFLLVIMILSDCNNVDENQLRESVDTSANQSENREGKARILKVSTDLEEEYGWFIIPEGVSTMTISAEVENVETILFWITPTGTEPWGERTLIDYDIDGSDGWSLQWEFGDKTFHDHITVQALGSNGVTQAKESFNVHSVDENNGE
ncbi:hypothetical protein PB01_15375 [Psychrobacillus glaciei]|uniref:Uncharacterized protein n=1 Tax=Psychrobacillus glaciei TaxID=2283160 RepID=A0A5J6SRI0_9BACI|nr:hypothetical protein [Psychrobacillus glaciei]QFG00094.1 hypothetical protein PB01_15375 [Psychrobacillus glaciei]